MPTVTVGLPAALTSPQPPRELACDARTIGEALRAVVEQAPQYEQRLFYGERLLVVVTLNGKHVPPCGVLEAELASGDRVDVMLPVAGG